MWLTAVYEVSSVTLVGRRGVARGGESRLWSLATPTGNYSEAELAGRRDGLLLDHALTQPWETLYFNDRKGNIQVSPREKISLLVLCLRIWATPLVCRKVHIAIMHRRDRLAPTVKHEARAFDGSRPCSRDVIVNFIRKPLADGSDKGPQELSI